MFSRNDACVLCTSSPQPVVVSECNMAHLLFQCKPASHAHSPGIVAAAAAPTATSSLEQQLLPPPLLRRLHRTGRRDGALRLINEMVFKHRRITAPPALVFAVN
jgi:hypothetical protein